MWIFLDDERDPPRMGNYSCATVVRSYEDFVSLIEASTTICGVSFDHDLGHGPTGMDCARFLVEYDLDHGVLGPRFTFTTHSMNPVGANNIRGLLDNYLRTKFG